MLITCSNLDNARTNLIYIYVYLNPQVKSQKFSKLLHFYDGNTEKNFIL